MRIVIALGGNALLDAGQAGTYEEQMANVKVAARAMLKIIDMGHQLVITHGNGPQVGNLAIQQSSTTEVPENPLHVLDAMTQGQIGYMIQMELGNLLRSRGSKRSVASLVTQVLVDRDDPAFRNPTKPIGPFYDEDDARRLTAEKGFVMAKVGKKGPKQYRRVVPSPDPVEIVEADIVTRLLAADSIAIAGGGGGIPVVRGVNGSYVGVDAVIDKDLCAERLAEAVKADALLILTNIDKVKVDYATPRERSVDSMTATEAKKFLDAGQFPMGSMGPKVTACVRFVEKGGKVGVIASLDKAVEALAGESGTRVVPG